MKNFFWFIFWVFINFLYFIQSGRIVGNIINQNKYTDGLNNMQNFCINEKIFFSI